MSTSKTVASRSVNFDGSSFRAVIPKEIADRYDLQDGDRLRWDDDGEGELVVVPPER